MYPPSPSTLKSWWLQPLAALIPIMTPHIYEHVEPGIVDGCILIVSVHIGDDARLQTVAIRPTVMYGEGDKFYVPTMLRTAKFWGGILPAFGNAKAVFQQVRAKLYPYAMSNQYSRFIWIN